jgi:hypothetical protein
MVTSRGWRRFFRRELGIDIRPVIVRVDEPYLVERSADGRLHVTKHEFTEESVLTEPDEDTLRFGYAMMIRAADGAEVRIEDVIVTKEAILRRREYSEEYKRMKRDNRADEALWTVWFQEFVLKTIVIYAVKHGPFLLDPSKYAFVAGVMDTDDTQETAEEPVAAARANVIEAPTDIHAAANRYLETGAADEQPLFEGAPTQERERVETTPVVDEQPLPPELAKMDAAKSKALAAKLEKLLPVEVVARLRTEHGIDIDADLPTSKYRVDKVYAYGKALRAAVNAKNSAASAAGNDAQAVERMQTNGNGTSDAEIAAQAPNLPADLPMGPPNYAPNEIPAEVMDADLPM